MDQPSDGSQSADKWIEFDHYRFIARGGGEDSDPEVFDVCYRYRAKVANPEEGRVVEGKVHNWQYEDDGAQYAILDSKSGYLAVRTNLHVLPTYSCYSQMRSVALDEPGRPLAWEVYRKNDFGAWTPIEGQHLRPRTAKAEDWLQAVSHPLDRLKEREQELLEGRAQLLKTNGQTPDQRGMDPGYPVVVRMNEWELNQKLKPFDQALAAVNKEIARGDDLVVRLHHQRGLPVTLMETAVEGRTLEMLPDLPPTQAQAVTVSAGHKMRL